MGINFFKWIKKDDADFMEQIHSDEIKKALEETKAEIAVRDMAYKICVQRIAKAIAKCEFQTYRKHKEVKGDLYYKLNVAPNRNQNATDFWTGFINKLYEDQEVLVVQSKDDNFYVADSYTLDDSKSMRDWLFKDVTVGTYKMPGNGQSNALRMADVYYFRLNNQNIKQLLDQTTDLYGRLITLSYQGYRKAQGRKFKLKIGRINQAGDKDIKDKLRRSIKDFLSSDDSVFIENEGHELSEVQSAGTRGSSANGATSRDITALLDDVLQITCKAFLMPTNIVTGEVTDTSKAVDDFLTFCLDYVVELIQDEINRKYFDQKEYLQGTYLRIDSSVIKHVDVFDLATSIDKLLSSGVFTINDLLRYMRAEPIQEDFANEHFMTKNYASIKDINNGLTDAENSGKENENAQNAQTDDSGIDPGGSPYSGRPRHL